MSEGIERPEERPYQTYWCGIQCSVRYKPYIDLEDSWMIEDFVVHLFIIMTSNHHCRTVLMLGKVCLDM